jgi:hypothetical protein
MQIKKPVEEFLIERSYFLMNYKLGIVQANLEKLILDKYNNDPVDDCSIFSFLKKFFFFLY